MKRLPAVLILFICAVFIDSSFVFGQGPPPPPTCETPPCTPIPIDAGISVLIAAGVVYGTKKIRDLNKKK